MISRLRDKNNLGYEEFFLLSIEGIKPKLLYQVESFYPETYGHLGNEEAFGSQ